MKSVHKILHLHHHKHTGKLLAHKHTSYRVLFLLMLLPIVAMVLADQMLVKASEFVVNATVPAVMPEGSPVITSPQNGAELKSNTVTVSGTCPIVNTPVVIAIYDRDTFVGSGRCSGEGTFSVPVVLSEGTHVIKATIVTVTNEEGDSSELVTVIYSPVVPVQEPSSRTPKPETAGILNQNVQSLSLLRIIPADIFVLMNPDGKVSWRGSFTGGSLPYTVKIEWGDGKSNTYTVEDQSEHVFTHDYDVTNAYEIIVTLTDASGAQTKLHSTAVTLLIKQGLSVLDTSMEQPPILAFLQKFAVQIYIGTFSALIFLWYLEHGRHILLHAANLNHHSKRRHIHH